VAEQELLFPTPLWRFRHPNRQVCAQLSQHVLVLERQDPDGLQITNQGGWHSSTDLLQDPAFQDMFHWIAARCHGAVQDWGWDLSKATPTFNNAWAMVNRVGHSTRAHLHPNSLLSGVIYLQVPEGAGVIAFLDPRSGAQMLLPPLRADAKQDHQGRLRYQPHVGEMLLFPAWLWHEVEPSTQDGERIALSFNIGMRPTGAA
jgi:uncharacterized protein (TIGR02466 family)